MTVAGSASGYPAYTSIDSFDSSWILEFNQTNWIRFELPPVSQLINFVPRPNIFGNKLLPHVSQLLFTAVKTIRLNRTALLVFSRLPNY